MTIYGKKLRTQQARRVYTFMRATLKSIRANHNLAELTEQFSQHLTIVEVFNNISNNDPTLLKNVINPSQQRLMKERWGGGEREKLARLVKRFNKMKFTLINSLTGGSSRA